MKEFKTLFSVSKKLEDLIQVHDDLTSKKFSSWKESQKDIIVLLDIDDQISESKEQKLLEFVGSYKKVFFVVVQPQHLPSLGFFTRLKFEEFECHKFEDDYLSLKLGSKNFYMRTYEKIYLGEKSLKNCIKIININFSLNDDFRSNKIYERINFLSYNLDKNFQELSNEIKNVSKRIDVLSSLPFVFRGHLVTFRLFQLVKPLLKTFLGIFSFKYLKKPLSRRKPEALPSSFKNVEFLLNENSSFQPNPAKYSSKPDISIIIPTYGKIDLLQKCLHSIELSENSSKYEIIIVDDCGPEKVNFESFKGFSVHKNKKNLGFTGSCNVGAELSKGKFLCFLNTDIIVSNKWLDKILNTFVLAGDVGIAGPRLLYPDGILQESGGTCFNDGDAINLGKNQSIHNSWFRYLKDVDYVSGACLVILKDDFKKIDGFDPIFTPAYYEDTSLCIDLRKKLNKRVIVNPDCEVIHFEGATNGTSTSSGIKKYQEINKSKFLEKHSEDLKSFGDAHENIWWQRDKYIQGNILIVDQCIPTPNKDSGSKDMDVILKSLLKLNYRPHIFALSNRSETPEVAQYLEQGVHCIYDSGKNFNEFYEEFHNLFEVVLISRVTSSKEVIDFIKSINPNAKIIFYTVDLHHVRMMEEYKLKNDEALLNDALNIKNYEIDAIRKSQRTIVLSDNEKNYLVNDCNINSSNIFVWNLIREINHDFKKDEESKEIIFIGGFQHTPNLDAVKWLEKKIVPELKETFEKNNVTFPGISVYGSNPNTYIKSLKKDEIKYMGFVEEESDIFKNAKLSLAPLRYGSGQKGKVLSSLIFKTPVVGTKFAFEGFSKGLDHIHLSSLDTTEFARKIFKVYMANEKQDWSNIEEHLEKTYSSNAFREKLKLSLEDLI